MFFFLFRYLQTAHLSLDSLLHTRASSSSYIAGYHSTPFSYPQMTRGRYFPIDGCRYTFAQKGGLMGNSEGIWNKSWVRIEPATEGLLVRRAKHCAPLSHLIVLMSPHLQNQVRVFFSNRVAIR